MDLPLKLYKSAGVPVTAAVHRLLKDANRARDLKDWGAAASGYRAALGRDATLAHIWIQLGHALKEGGDYAEAEAAYQNAARLRSQSAEPHLHLGHLKKRQGDDAGASRCYLRAARLEPSHPDALGELHALVSRGMDMSSADLLAILQPALDGADLPGFGDSLEATARDVRIGAQSLLQALRREDAALDEGALGRLSDAAEVLSEIERSLAERGPAGSGAGAPPLVFDVSDLIAYFRNARLPTGIQRVQIEIISSALQGGRAVKVCCFMEHRDEWLEIPPAAFIALCRLSLSDGDRKAPDWTAALARLYMLLNMAPAFVFPTGAFLINLGTSWWLQNYFLFVRRAKAEHGIRYVPFVHDMIPVMAGEHCTKELTQDFVSWVIGAFDHADFFLCNSEATKRDLLKVAAQIGHGVDETRIAVIRLDADFRKPGTAPAPRNALGRWGLSHTPFVLFVSTIEARKNHLLAFEAWTALVRDHGAQAIPKLVCVGNRGWLNDAIYAQLEANEALKAKVVMLSGLSDAELALLYERCLFTLYPSRYEGWGLPVTESLCYGKVPLVSDASSLPEAGGAFAAYFESGSVRQLTGALHPLIFEPARRKTLEDKIAQGFRPRTWREIADQVADQAAAWARSEDPGPAQAPQARLGAYYPMTRNFETRVWRGAGSAEVFRSGDGWWWPDDWGCWTKGQGGRLEIGLPEGHGPLRVYVQLHGLPGKPVGYRLAVGDGAPLTGALRPEEFKWIALEAPGASEPNPTLHVRLDGEDVEALGTRTEGQDGRVVSVGLAGFFLCDARDAVSRSAFLEAVALGDPSALAFNRESADRGRGGASSACDTTPSLAAVMAS